MTRASNVTVYGSLRYCPAGRGRPISPGLYKVPLHLRGSLSVAGTMRGRESWRSSMIVRRRTAERAGGWPPRVVPSSNSKIPDLDAAAVLYQVSSGWKYLFACVSYCTSDCSGTDKQKKLGSLRDGQQVWQVADGSRSLGCCFLAFPLGSAHTE